MNNTAELIREALEQAHMAGQAAAGVDPSYSGAQVYAREALANTAAAASLEAQEPVDYVDSYGTRLVLLADRPPTSAVPEAFRALHGRIKAMPGRVEPIGGQLHSYIQKDEALGWVEHYAAKQPAPTSAVPEGSHLSWAVDSWHEQVALRPLVNVHRRTLDSVWRQVIKRLGGDDVALCGPRHDDLLDERGNPIAAAPQQGGGEDE